MPSNPIALSKFDTSRSPLFLANGALDDLLIFVVVVLELTRGMYFQVPIWHRARVAEGVVDPSRLEDERAGRGDHDLAANVEHRPRDVERAQQEEAEDPLAPYIELLLDPAAWQGHKAASAYKAYAGLVLQASEDGIVDDSGNLRIGTDLRR